MADRHTPFDYQEADIQRMLAEPTRAILLASEMGRGKTLMAVELVTRLGFERVLYIGVKDTFHQWAERLAAQTDGVTNLLRIDATVKGRANYSLLVNGSPGHFFVGSQYLTAQDWITVPAMKNGQPVLDKKTGEPTMTRKQVGVFKKMPPVHAVVFDEVHVVANRLSKARKTLVTIRTDWKLAMSGTWMGNKFENAWSTSRWLWPKHVDASFAGRWKPEWCVTEDVYLPGGKVTQRVTGERTPGLYVSQLPCYIRAVADEQAPAPRRFMVNLSPAQREQYAFLERELLVWLDSPEGQTAIVADFPMVLRTRLRTMALAEMSLQDDGLVGFAGDAVSTKLHALGNILTEYGNQPVVIYTHSKRFAKLVTARLNTAGFNAVEWSGDVPSLARDKIKADFLALKVQYIVAVIASFSTGLDGFQRVCNKIVWLSEVDDGKLNDQATARIFRPGMTTGNGGFEQVMVLAIDTYDVKVFSALVQARLAMRTTLKAA